VFTRKIRSAHKRAHAAQVGAEENNYNSVVPLKMYATGIIFHAQDN
jgi:hypothetical protein